MSQVNPIDATFALHGSIMNRENDAVSKSQRNNHRPRLHTWSLLRRRKFAALAMLSRFR